MRCKPFGKGDDNVKEKPVTEEYERCVMCGARTGVPVSMPIDWRENYEMGVGQLCVACAKQLKED